LQLHIISSFLEQYKKINIMEFMDAATKGEFLKLSPNKKMELLRQHSLGLERGKALHEMQKLLFDLEAEERQYTAMEPRQLTNPLEFDVVITDINEADFSRIGEEFEVSRLSAADTVGTFPVTGIVYGSSHRTFVPLVVKKRNILVHLLFLVDTGSPNTYLREDSLTALGHTESIPSGTLVEINGVGLTVFPSRGHFANVDLLGQDFFTSFGAMLSINYKKKEVLITEC
jgi:hypothetical protein